MSLSHRLFSDALRDMQRAMAMFEQPIANNGRRALQNSILNNSGFGRYPATDMVETSDTYELHAEVPGYDKKDIKIEMPNDHTLILSGSTEKETTTGSDKEKAADKKEDKNKEKATENEQALQKKDDQSQQVTQYSAPEWWVNERVSGSFSRSFTFPTPIDQDKIKACYENGILKVIIPKNSKGQSRFITID
ncbi:HSP20-like chaperone [Cokeromyces recurvatus]|uniref:HSP20-like chaperone n=1 Tax=Cokeromyces recurvatus TaxID=90255 RepID=UPI00221FF24F|nr:HSP20-like chaperone [Cokeromyces recurvatus]KAI7905349.1 HSP20-like chaperone [Cokeromyces recurvatus]